MSQTHTNGDTFVDRRKSSRFAHWMTVLLVFYGSVALFSLAASLYGIFRVATVFEPLGDYPIQRVTNRLPGHDGPALYVGELLLVTAVKCSTAKEPVGSSGALYIARRGVGTLREFYLISTGAGIREPGCTTFNYRNTMPAEIVPGLWRLEGQEVAREGSQVQVKTYVSEDFLVVERPK